MDPSSTAAPHVRRDSQINGEWVGLTIISTDDTMTLCQNVQFSINKNKAYRETLPPSRIKLRRGELFKINFDTRSDSIMICAVHAGSSSPCTIILVRPPHRGD